MQPDRWLLYRHMLHSRLFEEAVAQLWEEGLISGEMHLGMGEEAIAAGVVTQLEDGDALALDHRGTPPLLMRGVNPVGLLRELMGHPDGLCAGQGGHMHLFSRQHLAASSGIVGASGPAAAGFALAAQHLGSGRVAVAFFGEGAMNQGMLLEALNLAVVWKLPALFVCKDNGWSITTPASSVIGGELTARAEGFGMPAVKLDGLDVEAVWRVAQQAIDRARKGSGPTFLHADCVHLEGHLLGDPMLRIARSPVKEMTPMVGSLIKALVGRKGATARERARLLADVGTRSFKVAKDETADEQDPLDKTREALESDPARLETLEQEVALEIQQIVENALA
jgi:pyruvate dehydrogenase E1 component alpha subunit